MCIKQTALETVDRQKMEKLGKSHYYYKTKRRSTGEKKGACDVFAVSDWLTLFKGGVRALRHE